VCLGVCFFMLLASLLVAGPSLAAEVKLVIDGKEMTTDPAPMIDAGRTLVPLRIISEELGGLVSWSSVSKKVEIINQGRVLDMRIDDPLVAYDVEAGVYEIIDVPPRLVDSRTFVPLRLVSNALNVAISWDANSKTVSVNSNLPATVIPFFTFGYAGVDHGEVITGTKFLRLIGNGDPWPEEASQVRFMLIDPSSHKGTMVAGGKNLDEQYIWIPRVEDAGEKLLVAGLYDAKGRFVAGVSKKIIVQVDPSVILTGITPGQMIDGHISLRATTNFVASYVKYQFTNRTTGKNVLSERVDPYGFYTYAPEPGDNGEVVVHVFAYDQEDQGVLSDAYTVSVNVARSLSLAGVKEGERITDSVTLSTRRNFPVSKTQYVMLDPGTGQETILKELGYGNYVWTPGLAIKGERYLFVRVYDTQERPVESARIKVILEGEPSIRFSGVGPGGVVSQSAKLTISSNVSLLNQTFVMKNISTGKTVSYKTDSVGSWTLNPTDLQDGSWEIYAQGSYEGETIRTETVSFRIFTGTTYPARPIVPKDQFLDLVTKLAVKSRQETGMSAALQVAQAILETGWGQYIPVDKYTGKFSYNLFGIKGSASNGSVVSNTWEEYNGVAFRTDASFRAYYSVEQSWADHKRILLELSRYEIFRDVMYDPVLGAYAIRRAGYATDSLYPQKLIDIIEQYDLWTLDEVGMGSN